MRSKQIQQPYEQGVPGEDFEYMTFITQNCEISVLLTVTISIYGLYKGRN